MQDIQNNSTNEATLLSYPLVLVAVALLPAIAFKQAANLPCATHAALRSKARRSIWRSLPRRSSARSFREFVRY